MGRWAFLWPVQPAAQASSAGFPIDYGLAEAADGVGEIDSISAAQVVDGQHALFRVWVGGEDMTPVNPGEQAAVDGRRLESAVLFDEDVVDCGFGDLVALIQEEDVFMARFDRGLEGLRVERAVGGLVKIHGVLRVGALRGDAETLRLGRGLGEWLGGDLDGAVRA